MLDLLIRGGTVVDGTGAPGRRADVGVRDGRIVEIGEITDAAAETVDATGMVVCPGFVDPHTHYDAQLFWDPRATPSNLHGVTSIVAGNCGFTLAPVHPQDVDYLARMMQKVEGMPLAALEQGVPWNWTSYAEYLDRLDGNLAVNAAFLVGHCAIRRHVMGEEATKGEASEEQLAQMEALLHEAIEAGGLGFSTTLARTHSDGAGDPVASRWASTEEVLRLCEAVAEHEGTTLEFASDGSLDGFDEADVDLMTQMSLRGQRPLNWNVLTPNSAERDRFDNQLQAMDRVAEAGAKVVGLTMPIIVGMNMSFLNYCALNMLPDWGDVLGLPVPDRVEKLRDPEVRIRLKERAASPDAGVFSRLTGWDTYIIGDTFSDANEGLKWRRVNEIAAERGDDDPFDTLLDIVIADDLRTVLWPSPTDSDDESWAMRAESWEHPGIMIGGSDAGAHLDRMCGAPYTTKWLGDSIRGRRLTSMERAVQQLSDVPAQLFGLRDRGRVAEGYHADIVVFDPETVDAGEVYLRADLPGDEKRLYADAIGVQRVFVNGVATVVDGEAVDTLPGIVLRSGRDTRTVTPPGA